MRGRGYDLGKVVATVFLYLFLDKQYINYYIYNNYKPIYSCNYCIPAFYKEILSFAYLRPMPIVFNNADVKFKVPRGTEVKKFIAAQVLAEAGKKIRLSYVFCSDEYLLQINRQFLQHDYYTDIITFPLSDGVSKTVESELYISIDRIADNAKKHKVEFELELFRVIFHGILHLIGYNDKTAKQEKAMRAKEDEWLKLFYQTI